MNIARLSELVGKLAYFDLPTLAQLAGEPRHTLGMQLYRWTKRGVIVPLRRGMYVLGKSYRHAEPSPAVLANALYQPSYLSLHWAMGYYGLIPEYVVRYTSITARKPYVFDNEFGSFSYVHIKPECFSGYHKAEIDGKKVLLATPEKALLDFWYSEAGEWTLDRMEGMRFQNFDMISAAKLDMAARAFRSPRVVRACRNWRLFVEEEAKGEKTL